MTQDPMRTPAEQPVEPQPAIPQPPVSQTVPQASQPSQVGSEEPDLFGDHITEERLGALLDVPRNGEAAPPAEAPQDEAAPNEAAAKEEAQKAEAQKAEAPTAAPEAYDIELFGKEARLSGEQVIDLCEAGAQFLQHRPQVETALRFMQAVQEDRNLQAVLEAYAAGRPLPAEPFPQAGQAAQAAPQAHQPPHVDEPLLQLRQQVAAELAPVLRQQLMTDIQEHYKTFVEDVSRFAAEQRHEKAFGQYTADPDYTAVNDMMQRNLLGRVAEGAITHEQAAQIDRILKSDPAMYGDYFAKFKVLVGRNRQTAPPATQPGGPVTTAQRAPRLEGGAVQGDEAQARYRQTLSRALSGDAAALGALL